MKNEAAPPILQHYDRPPGVALAEMQVDIREAWRTRCAIQGATEHCEQASSPDSTHFGLQGVDLACETECLAGSQPAPVVTPPFFHF